VPEFRNHGVGSFRPNHSDVSDVVVYFDVKAGICHITRLGASRGGCDS